MHHPQPPVSRIRYLPALDGLRGLAVLAVIGYHAELGWLPGGFLGVELFFVVSGFLITSLLLAELRSEGRIDLRRFWVRRARRLLPALALLLLVVAATVRLALPEEVARNRSGLLAAVTYVTNWELVWSGQSYFEAIGRPPLLQHLWSLGVEEQYYLLWPLLVAGLAALGGHRAVAVACAVGAVASTALMWLLVDPSAPSRVYYGTDTRAGGLLLGGLLAVTLIGIRAPRPRPQVRRAMDVVGGAALLGLLHLLVRTSEFDTRLYQGGFLRFAGVTALLLFVISVPGSIVARALAQPPLVWVGLRSYGLYLWHWPVFQLTRPQLDIALDGPALLALRLAITFALAEVSFQLVERPVREGWLGRRLQRERERAGSLWASSTVRLSGAGATLAVGLVVAGFVVTPAAPSDEVLAAAIGIATPVTAERTPSTSTTTTARPPRTTTTSAATAGGDAAAEADATAPVPTAPPTTPPTTAAPTTTTAPVAPYGPTARPVHAVGDSVLLAASEAVTAAFGGSVTIDAVVGRQPGDGVAIVEAWAPAHPGVDLVVSLGNNGILRDTDVDRIMAAAGPDRLVVFVNVAVPRRWEAPTNEVLAAEVAAHPNALLIDWHALVAQQPGLLGRDRIHPAPAGDDAFASWVRAPFPNAPPPPVPPTTTTPPPRPPVEVDGGAATTLPGAAPTAG